MVGRSRPPVKSAPRTTAAAEPRSRDVILVDDDALARAALGRLLRGAGYNVVAFERPSDALLNPLPATNACLILDIYMPEMSGIALWEVLRKRGFTVPTVLITGRHDERTRLYGQQISAVAILYKPIEEKDLFEAVEQALGRNPG